MQLRSELSAIYKYVIMDFSSLSKLRWRRESRPQVIFFYDAEDGEFGDQFNNVDNFFSAGRSVFRVM